MNVQQWNTFKELMDRNNISLYEDKCLFFLNHYLKVIK